MDDRTVGIVLVTISAVGFGTLGVLGIVAGDAGLSIPTILALRFGLATLLLWPILWSRGRLRLLRGRTLAVGLALGGVGYATMSGLYFVGLEFMTAGLVAIVLYTYPAFVVCFVLASNPERVSGPVVLALVFSVGGVVLITGADPAGADPRGVVVVLGSALAYATYIVVSGRALRTVDADILSAYVMPAAAVTFLLIGGGTGTLALPSSATAWLAVAGIALFATAIPILTFFAGLARIGPSRASIVSTFEPAVTVVLGAIFLAEPVTAVTVAGGALVVLGVVLINREDMR